MVYVKAQKEHFFRHVFERDIRRESWRCVGTTGACTAGPPCKTQQLSNMIVKTSEVLIKSYYSRQQDGGKAIPF